MSSTHVLATAGHVDHGKSTLVRALTGLEPDRWAEERRRGMTLDLGFAWTRLAGVGDVAFVDVPGHERFVPTMLAGVGPVPAVLFVVAADEGWREQSGEHLAAIDALGVRHGLLAVTRSDLADPAPAIEQARTRIARTSLGLVDAVAVSGRTGNGLDLLRDALARLVARLPEPDSDAPAFLWVDRVFTIGGAGTVVTGTLPAGTLRVGDELDVLPGNRRVGVRGLQVLGRPVEQVSGVARVALNLRGVDRHDLRRGDVLAEPGTRTTTSLVDVRVTGAPLVRANAEVVLHLGSAALPARVRPLDDRHARLQLRAPSALIVGDRGLLRDPGRRDVLAGVTVLDPLPPALGRRGAATARARSLALTPGQPDAVDELRRRGVVSGATMRRLGVPPPALPPASGDWYVDGALADRLREQLVEAVEALTRDEPLSAGLPLEAARQALGLPDQALVRDLVKEPLGLRAGRVVAGRTATLPPALQASVAVLRSELAARPFAAPDAQRLRELALGARELAAAERHGELLRLTPDVVLLPDAPEVAARALSTLGEAFTVSEAKAALGTSRRVAVPLLELLDARLMTRRTADGRRRMLGAADPAG
ncbi:MAG: selenocysteine-specific elongation factor [Actinomycetota bacterium]|jgi:selenocysteine-specific elongation factor|nr:selenocysteine-specific elongation factor [Actinomycetota bacterium]